MAHSPSSSDNWALASQDFSRIFLGLTMSELGLSQVIAGRQTRPISSDYYAMIGEDRELSNRRFIEDTSRLFSALDDYEFIRLVANNGKGSAILRSSITLC